MLIKDKELKVIRCN